MNNRIVKYNGIMDSITNVPIMPLVWRAVQAWNDSNDDCNRCLTSLKIIDHVGRITCQVKPAELKIEYEGKPLSYDVKDLVSLITCSDLQNITLSSKNPILRKLKVDRVEVFNITSSDPILEFQCTHPSDHFADLLAEKIARDERNIITIAYACDAIYNADDPYPPFDPKTAPKFMDLYHR